jgi:hypothetical protein
LTLVWAVLLLFAAWRLAVAPVVRTG